MSELWCDAPAAQATHQGDISQYSASFSWFLLLLFHFSPLGKRGKASSPACRTLGFVASTCPAPGRRWSSKGHLPSHWHAQGTVSMLIIPAILGKALCPISAPVSHPWPCVPSLPLCHTSALRCRHTMDRGSHLGCLSKAC